MEQPSSELSKSKRLQEIFLLVEIQPPANTAKEANVLLARSFNTVEEKVMTDDRMFVLDLEGYGRLELKDKIIYHNKYNEHFLYIRDNGAIDIRRVGSIYPTKDRILENHSFVPENLELVIEKPGADGIKVWD
jgi:hypothetical protein